MTNTYLISVHPRWASAFFLSHKPKTIELRKGSFGASLKPGDSIAIYATLPTAELLGTVRLVKREILRLSDLWRASKEGKLARVSETQFNAYYANQSSGVGVWVEAVKLLPKPIPLCKLRQNWGSKWNPPQQIQRVADEQLVAVGISHQLNQTLLCYQ